MNQHTGMTEIEEYVISSDEGCWSNEDGWVDKKDATVFNQEERNSFNLPIGPNVRWEQKETVKEKATRLAREDWNQQCTNFIMGRAKFRDSSLKACRNRILKDLLAKQESLEKHHVEKVRK